MTLKKYLVLLFVFVFFTNYAQQGKTEIVEINNQFHLIRNGSPYFIKGAGGDTKLSLLKEIGGNSIRTWTIDNAKSVLDKAHEYGISVCIGLWVGHERHGFDYNDEYSVEAQLLYFEREVMKIKDHPALLMWAVGNEVDLFYKNFRVWNAVEDISKMIKKHDSNHPIMTVTAGIDPAEVYMIKNYCPSVDILGINTYGGVQSLSKSVKMFGWDKPYIVTEWGPYGHWESPMTDWGVAVESTSKEKAEFRKIAYKYITSDTKLCLGSYAFLWGHKQEQTPTWYGLFTEDGRSTQSIDILNEYWSNSRKNKAPIIEKFQLNGLEKEESIRVKKGSECYFTYDYFDFENDSLNFEFILMPESTDKKVGGDFETTPEPIKFNIVRKNTNTLVINSPKKTGAYRFFIYIRDNGNNVATANIPFYVK